MILRNLSSVMLFVSLVATASNENASDKEAQDAYKYALSKIVLGKSQLLKGQAISFIEESEEQSGNKQSKQIQLHLNAQGEEVLTLHDEIEVEDEELNWESNVLINPNSFPKTAQLIKETETTWCFSIPTLVNADVGEADQDLDSDKINRKIASVMVSELTVSKKSPRFISLTTYAKQQFKPDPLVNVAEFRVRIDYSQAWPKGPWVTSSISKVLKGSYAFFIDVDEFSLKTYHKFKLIN